ncbi:hypothetical protein Tco_1277176 [Tanacetum coccineum]
MSQKSFHDKFSASTGVVAELKDRVLFPKPFYLGVDGGRLVTTSPSAILTDIIGMDKAKTTRKRLKPGKLEHENGRAREKPGESYQSQKWST